MSAITRLLSLLLALSLMTAAAVADGSIASQTKQAAAAYDAKDWNAAARLYGELARTSPDPRTWNRLGISLNHIGLREQAIAAFNSGIKAGLPQPNAEFGIASAYGAGKNVELAMQYLGRAVEHGWNDPEQIAASEDLKELRGDAQFALLVEHAKRNRTPCAYSAESRQFDFWLGEWDVVTSKGESPAGNSKIELILGDCVVQENWRSLGAPYSGQSYNIYNAALKRWEQYWVDDAGGNIFFYGGLKDGVMDYWTDDIPQPDGKMLRRHLQFSKIGPNQVRQFSQGSTDGGKSWYVEYDFTYNRKS
jgi:hypothetical protein